MQQGIFPVLLHANVLIRGNTEPYCIPYLYPNPYPNAIPNDPNTNPNPNPTPNPYPNAIPNPEPKARACTLSSSEAETKRLP